MSKVKYPPLFIHLRLDAIYTAEHIVLELEQGGYFDHLWEASPNTRETDRTNAIGSIRRTLSNNLMPDKTLPIDYHRSGDAYTGARIIAYLRSNYVKGIDDKYADAQSMTNALDKNPKLLNTLYTPAYSVDAYLAAQSDADNPPQQDGSKKRQPKRFLIAAAVAGLFFAGFATATMMGGWLGNITEQRRTEGANEINKLLEQHVRPESKTDEIIAQIEDEKSLYRYAENAILSGDVRAAEGLFQHILATTQDKTLAMFARHKMAEAILMQGDLELAREILEAVAEEIKTTPYAWYRPEMIHFIGATHILEGSPASIQRGLEFVNKAENDVYEIASRQGFPNDKQRRIRLAFIYQTRTLGLILQRRFDEAAQSAEKSLDYFRMVHDNYETTKVNILRAFIYYQQNDYVGRRRMMRKAEHFAIPNGEKRLYTFINVVRRHIDRCEGAPEDLTDGIIEQHLTDTGDALPLLYDKLFANLACQERKE